MLTGYRVVGYDDHDREMMARGLRRASTGRLRQLIASTAKLAPGVVAQHLDLERPFADLGSLLVWRRSRGTWVCSRTYVEAETYVAGPRLPGAMTTIDAVDVLGSPEVMAARTIRIGAVDFGRWRFSLDFGAVVRPDGTLGPLKPVLPVAPEAQS